MISSFWNLCRACPSMPVEKLHSEYRSTFQWHEYVGSSRTDPVPQLTVVRQPTQTQSQAHLSSWTGRPVEPTIPRRKKHPDLAYKTSNGWLTKSTTVDEPSSNTGSRIIAISGTATGGPRKSISMGTIRSCGNVVPVHSAQRLSLIQQNMNSAEDSGTHIAAMEPHVVETTNRNADSGDWAASHSTEPKKDYDEKTSAEGRNQDDHKRKEYKSEYKKRFRPFSQYEYVDGKFLKKKGDQDIGNPWYKEVIELRKKAGEYKYRGWGTELVPQHIAQVYNQQLWDQVSRRSSLAALALITTTPKSISKEEKDKENARKTFSGKSATPRPHTATPKHPMADLERSKSKDSSETVQPSKKKLLEGNRTPNKSSTKAKETSDRPRPPFTTRPTSTLETKTRNFIREARSQSAGPGGRSPRKTMRQQSSASSVSDKDSIGGGWKVHLESHMDHPPKPQQRHPRPNIDEMASEVVALLGYENPEGNPPYLIKATLATSPRPKASSGKGDRDSNSKLAKQQQFDKSSADPSLGYYEPVVKSPPEPTRVKSPEQVILRSPDPVNWTVPLDTTKSFTVTQNIREAPPSPRFRAGERLHGDARSIHHPSTQHSSAGSTIASSPISSFSARSAPVPLSSCSGQAVFAPKSALMQASGESTLPHHRDQSVRSAADVCGAGAGTGAGQLANLESKLTSNSHPPHPNVNGYEDKEKVEKDKEKVVTLAKKSSSTPQPHSTELKQPSKEQVTSKGHRTSSDTAKPIATLASSSTEKTSTSKAVPGTTLRCLEDPTFMFDPPKSTTTTNTTTATTTATSAGPPLPQPTTTAATTSTTSAVPASASASATSTAPASSVPSSAYHRTPPVKPPSHHPRGSIRVLEAPVTSASVPKGRKSEELSFVPPAPVAAPKRSIVGMSHMSETPPPQSKGSSYRVLEAPEDPLPFDQGLSVSVISPSGRSRASDVLEKARNRFDKFWGKSKDDEK